MADVMTAPCLIQGHNPHSHFAAIHRRAVDNDLTQLQIKMAVLKNGAPQIRIRSAAAVLEYLVSALTKNGGTYFSILVRVVGHVGATFVQYFTAVCGRIQYHGLNCALFFDLIHHLVHPCHS